MKSRRLFILLPAISIFAVFLWFGWFTNDDPVPHYFERGERLDVVSLKSNERIEVRKVFFPCRADPIVARDYLIGGGSTPTFRVFALKWDRGSDGWITDRLIASPSLSLDDRVGLDLMFSVFRSRREEHSSAIRSYAVRYLRDDVVVGDAVFVGFFVTDEVSYFAERGFRDDSDYEYDYDRLSEAYDLPKGSTQAMVTLEMLEEKTAQPGATDNPDDAQRI